MARDLHGPRRPAHPPALPHPRPALSSRSTHSRNSLPVCLIPLAPGSRGQAVPLPSERVDLEAAPEKLLGRRLAEDAVNLAPIPPFPVQLLTSTSRLAPVLPARVHQRRHRRG